LWGFFKQSDRPEAESLLQELEELVETLGVPIVDRMMIFGQRHAPSASSERARRRKSPSASRRRGWTL
jgi:50S ribosomal subunit-associated GTPase HflX